MIGLSALATGGLLKKGFDKLGGLSGLESKFKSMTGTDRATSTYDKPTQDLVSTLQAQSQGKGPSLVGEQAKQASDNALANTVSSIKSTGGVNQALKSRMALRAGERAGSQVARDTTIGKLKERQDAQKTLGSVLAGARGQDLDAETSRKKEKASLFGKGMQGLSNAFGGGSLG